MCAHAYEVDVGNTSLTTSQYTIHIVGLQQAAVTRHEQLWNPECVGLLARR